MSIDPQTTRHAVMCSLYVVAIAIGAQLTFPMNLIQCGVCAVLLPIRLTMLMRGKR
jgi:hypothetical protein